MRTISTVTVARSDWGIYRPVLDQIRKADDLQLRIIASGAHLSQQSGLTVGEITKDGFRVDDSVDMMLSADTPVGIAKSMGVATLGFADCYNRHRPDLLLLLGDRYEMHAAATAAIPFGIPIAHIHGGEVTGGAIDEALRHAITKYSHLHFASTQDHANRIIQMGEEPWRVTVSGAPALDQIGEMQLLSLDEIERRINQKLTPAPILVTYHPVTLQHGEAAAQVAQLVEALSQIDRPMVITRPGADTEHSIITQRLQQFCADRRDACLVDNLGTQTYFSLMSQAAAMIGNSSSGIIEAASFRLPVINIGLRQAGRSRSANTIDVACSSEEILGAFAKATSSAFIDKVRNVRNVYGDGCAANRIVEKLRTVELGTGLLHKTFHDLEIQPGHSAAA